MGDPSLISVEANEDHLFFSNLDPKSNHECKNLVSVSTLFLANA